MALVTGSPIGSTVAQEEVYIDGAPNIYYQDYTADPLNNPDGDGYYWGLSGTSTYPVKALACVTEVSMAQNITLNDIRCDAVGVKGTIQQRDSVDLTFTLQTLFPLSIFAELNNFSPADVGTGTEKVGMGTINNQKYWHVYCPKVYDRDTGDYLLVHLHKCQLVEVGELQMQYGQPWAQSMTFRAFADDTYADTMLFGTIIRADASALP